MFKKLYKIYCKTEEIIVSIGFLSIVLLTFSNVILRKFFNAPITVADDLSLFLFSWASFLGADVALRYSRLVGMDILVNKLSPKVQKVIQLLVYVIIISSLILFANTGFGLALGNWKRNYNSLPISYGWATLSLPISCCMMIFTSIIKMSKIISNFNDDNYNVKKDNDELIGEENTGLDAACVSK